MITKSIISLMYETASIQRWNDHIRPSTGFSELDKQAHKLFYAYVLAKCEGDNVDMLKLVEGGIFEFFHRSILTDIKPPIYHKLVEEKGKQIDKWVLEVLKEDMEALGGGFYERMCRYYTEEDYAKLEKKILYASNYLASNWEFKVIYPMNKETHGIEQVKLDMVKEIASCDSFDGYKYYAGSPYMQQFLSLIGKLRYQQRWAKAVRLPLTFVMGHMLIVAILSYFCTLELENPCSERLINNFLCGLFHDLPESLTRDIVSPVKSSVKGLGNLISGIEIEQMNKVIYPLLPKKWHRKIRYYTEDEFFSKIIEDNEIKKVTSDIINEKYNDNAYEPIDGEIVRGCDHLSACIEAYMSISYGVKSEQIVTGYNNLMEIYKDRTIGGINFGELFRYFKEQ
ncbi:MAG: HD domain-containing protein [Clostridia bacterium]|nr:HD domain-containing protein [Clostridia bacterium]